MSRKYRIELLYELLKDGDAVSRAGIAEHLGMRETPTQSFLFYIAKRGVPVEPTAFEGRRAKAFRCTDVPKFKEIVDSGGRMRVVETRKPRKSPSHVQGEILSAAAAKQPKRRKEPEPDDSDFLDDVAAPFDIGYTADVEFKLPPVLDAEPITRISDREMRDILYSLGLR